MAALTGITYAPPVRNVLDLVTRPPSSSIIDKQ
jgi:hypothetical protein